MLASDKRSSLPCRFGIEDEKGFQRRLQEGRNEAVPAPGRRPVQGQPHRQLLKVTIY